MRGSEAETTDSSSLLATRLTTGLSLFQPCTLSMVGPFRVFTGAESTREASGTLLHRLVG